MLRRTDLLVRQTIIVRQGNRWLKPKLGLAVGTLHVNVYPGLFAREKVKPKAAIAEYCGAHGGPIAGKGSVWHITMRLSDAGCASDKRRQFIQIIDPLLGLPKTRPAIARTDC